MQSIETGDFVLDIGTHKGGYLHWLRATVGSEGWVTAFEPQPSLYEYVRQAIEAYNYKNITLYHAGVSSRESTLDLFIPKAKGLTSLREPRLNQEIKPKMDTLLRSCTPT